MDEDETGFVLPHDKAAVPATTTPGMDRHFDEDATTLHLSLYRIPDVSAPISTIHFSIPSEIVCNSNLSSSVFQNCQPLYSLNGERASMLSFSFDSREAYVLDLFRQQGMSSSLSSSDFAAPQRNFLRFPSIGRIGRHSSFLATRNLEDFFNEDFEPTEGKKVLSTPFLPHFTSDSRLSLHEVILDEETGGLASRERLSFCPRRAQPCFLAAVKPHNCLAGGTAGWGLEFNGIHLWDAESLKETSKNLIGCVYQIHQHLDNGDSFFPNTLFVRFFSGKWRNRSIGCVDIRSLEFCAFETGGSRTGFMLLSEFELGYVEQRPNIIKYCVFDTRTRKTVSSFVLKQTPSATPSHVSMTSNQVSRDLMAGVVETVIWDESAGDVSDDEGANDTKYYHVILWNKNKIVNQCPIEESTSGGRPCCVGRHWRHGEGLIQRLVAEENERVDFLMGWELTQVLVVQIGNGLSAPRSLLLLL